MRVAYIYNNPAEALGVTKKILAQANLLEQKHEVLLLNIAATSHMDIFRRAISADFIYCRDGLAVTFFVIALRLFSREKIILEVNNSKGSLRGRRNGFLLWIRSILQSLAVRCVTSLVAVTREILNSYEPNELKKSVIPNVWGWERSPNEWRRGPQPEKKFTFIFLGDLGQSWQGQAKLIQLLEYDESISLMTIGPHVSWPDSVINRVTEMGVIDCKSKQLYLCQQAKIGVSALEFQAIRGLTEASPLKHLVYCEAALPVLTGCIDKLLIDSGYPHIVWTDTAKIHDLVLDIEALANQDHECITANKRIDREVQIAKQRFLRLFE